MLLKSTHQSKAIASTLSNTPQSFIKFNSLKFATQLLKMNFHSTKIPNQSKIFPTCGFIQFLFSPSTIRTQKVRALWFLCHGHFFLWKGVRTTHIHRPWQWRTITKNQRRISQNMYGVHEAFPCLCACARSLEGNFVLMSVEWFSNPPPSPFHFSSSEFVVR